ncbi:MAG: sulfur carrier protein ThiS adenylyltransferase ThiF [Bacteroidales bacterium]
MNIQLIKGKLSSKTVGIAGCGGLGSNCAAALARTGIGQLIIVDFDTIDESNLNRQYYFRHQLGMKKVEALSGNLQMINPETIIKAHHIRLDAGNIPVVFRHCDVIVEAFDKAEMKEMIIETVAEKLPEIPLVVGNGMAGWGRNNILMTARMGDNLYVCGDNMSDIDDGLPVLAPRVGIVSMMQANTVLNILLKTENTMQL